LSSLAGAVAMLVGGAMMLAVVLIGVVLLRCAAYVHMQAGSPGLTTSVALIITVLLGGFSIEAPGTAAALGVVVAVLLAARSALHTFAQSTPTDAEVRDGLILASVSLVVLPVLPDEPFGPGGLLNLGNIFLIVVLVMALGALGHICTRLFGARVGLPLSGFFSGFVSSAATIVAMGQRSTSTPSGESNAAAGAVLSSVSSFVQIAFVIGALSLPMLQSSAIVLFAVILVAGVYGAVFTLSSLRHTGEAAPMELSGKVFSVRTAVVFAVTVTLTMLIAALLQEYFGNAAVALAAGVAGLVSTQSAAAALAALVVAGKIGPDEALLPLVLAISANILVRILLARSHGNGTFSRIVIAGLVLSGLAAWAGWAVSSADVVRP